MVQRQGNTMVKTHGTAIPHSSPLSSLSSSSAPQRRPSSSTFLADIYAQADRFDSLPDILLPSSLPPLSPAARKRISTITERFQSQYFNRRNGPEIFLASCRLWRGPLSWTAAEQREDEDADVMSWRNDVPDSVQQLEEWRAEWRELRKSENRTSLGAPLPGSSKRKRPAAAARRSQSSTSAPRTASLDTLQNSSGPARSSHTLSAPTVAIVRTISQQQMLSFPSAKPTSSSSTKGKGTQSSYFMAKTDVIDPIHDDDRPKRSWDDVGDMTIFQDFLPPSFPSHLAQSTPPRSSKRHRPRSIHSVSTERSLSPVWHNGGTQLAIDGIDSVAADVVAMMGDDGDEFERALRGDT